MPYKNQVIRNTYQRQYAARKRKEAKEARQTSAGKPPKGNPGDVVADWAEATLKVPTGTTSGPAIPHSAMAAGFPAGRTRAGRSGEWPLSGSERTGKAA